MWCASPAAPTSGGPSCSRSRARRYAARSAVPARPARRGGRRSRGPASRRPAAAPAIAMSPPTATSAPWPHAVGRGRGGAVGEQRFRGLAEVDHVARRREDAPVRIDADRSPGRLAASLSGRRGLPPRRSAARAARSRGRSRPARALARPSGRRRRRSGPRPSARPAAPRRAARSRGTARPQRVQARELGVVAEARAGGVEERDFAARRLRGPPRGRRRRSAGRSSCRSPASPQPRPDQEPPLTTGDSAEASPAGACLRVWPIRSARRLPASGWCLPVSGSCLRASGWCLPVSGSALPATLPTVRWFRRGGAGAAVFGFGAAFFPGNAWAAASANTAVRTRLPTTTPRLMLRRRSSALSRRFGRVHPHR